MSSLENQVIQLRNEVLSLHAEIARINSQNQTVGGNVVRPFLPPPDDPAGAGVRGTIGLFKVAAVREWNGDTIVPAASSTGTDETKLFLTYDYARASE